MSSALAQVGNPSSLHSDGRAARRGVEDARDHLAREIGCASSEIIFTSSGTEANNIAIKGIFWHRNIDKKRSIVITSAIEHQVAQSEVLPALNLVLTGYSAGLRGDYNAAGAFTDQFSIGQPGLGVGFDFEIPYKNRAARAAAEQRRIAMARIQNQFEVVVGEVSQDVRSQAIQRNKFIAVLPQQWESLVLSQRLLVNTETRRRFLADGTQVADLYLDNLLQIQSRLEASEFAMLQAQVNFAMADMGLQRSVANLKTLATPESLEQLNIPGAETSQRPIIEGQMIGR
jgi:hypothetical protein